ncbi:MAG TPA: hemolysin III family protein [Acidimicrobiia bacterium]|nr:hemolysin III family protein [Acidimicrobiia bacterium]
MDPQDRLRLGKMTHPVRGMLHGIAAAGFLVAGVLLVALSPGGLGRRLSLVAFGVSLVALFTTSSLYHSVPWQAVWKARMQKLDHTMINVLVAGTFTPIAVIVLEGWLEVVTLVVQWGIVAFGAVNRVVSKGQRHWASIALSTTQGWLAVLLLWPLSHRLPGTPLVLMGIGGLCYTVGMVFLVTGRPRLWPRVFSYHEAFHVLVVVAAAVHFAAIAAYVAPYPG